MRPARFLQLVIALLALAGARTAAAADVPVDLELVLAVDVSRSMDRDEQILQRKGYAEAFRDPELLLAIGNGRNDRIAVTYVEWAGARDQAVIVPWRIVGDAASALAFASEIEAGSPSSLDRTSISNALRFSAALFEGNGIAGTRRAIDISGDGPNNAGGPVAAMRDLIVGRGIVINGLPIMSKEAVSGGIFDYEHLDRYYRDCVIGGQGSFMVTIRTSEQIGPSIRKKLLLEISGEVPQLVLVAGAGDAAEPADCLIGEKRWKSFVGPGSGEP